MYRFVTSALTLYNSVNLSWVCTPEFCQFCETLLPLKRYLRVNAYFVSGLDLYLRCFSRYVLLFVLPNTE